MKKDAGFAMADALIALIIASLFISSLIAMNTTMVRTQASAAARLNATLLAKSLIETEDLGEETGEALIDGKTYSWRKQVTARPVDAFRQPEVSLIETAVSVEWSGHSTLRQLEMTAKRVRPSNDR